MGGGFWLMEHRSPRDTQLPFDMLFITMFYTCHVTEDGVSQGGTASYKKKFKTLYSLIQKDIKILLNKIWYTYTALIPTNMMFSLLNKCKF